MADSLDDGHLSPRVEWSASCSPYCSFGARRTKPPAGCRGFQPNYIVIGTSSIFCSAKNLHSEPLDRLDFCRCHFAAENGEQDLTTLPPAFGSFILTAKPSALVRLLTVGFAVALPLRPRPLPKNRIRANASPAGVDI